MTKTFTREFGALMTASLPRIVAFFSVFIFMFKGRTATFAGLVNRLTSLVAGTTATLIQWLAFAGHLPRASEWIALGLIFVAVGFLAVAERRRAREVMTAPVSVTDAAARRVKP